jgi:hypothetical protein
LPAGAHSRSRTRQGAGFRRIFARRDPVRRRALRARRLKSVDAQLARLKASYENKDYNDVIAGTPQLSKAVDSLENAVKSGKAQANAALAAAKTEWQSLSVEVPKMVEDIQARVDELSKEKRLPWGLNKDEFAKAKADFENMKTQWTDASDEYKSGKQVMAVEKARVAKDMNGDIREQLKMKGITILKTRAASLAALPSSLKEKPMRNSGILSILAAALPCPPAPTRKNPQNGRRHQATLARCAMTPRSTRPTS